VNIQLKIAYYIYIPPVMSSQKKERGYFLGNSLTFTLAPHEGQVARILWTLVHH
jgi:hypothetical protein